MWGKPAPERPDAVHQVTKSTIALRGPRSRSNVLEIAKGLTCFCLRVFRVKRVLDKTFWKLQRELSWIEQLGCAHWPRRRGGGLGQTSFLKPFPV